MNEVLKNDSVAGTPVNVIARQAVRGVLWTYVSFAGSKALAFVSTIVLARLLVPAEFGQVAFAMLVIAYLETIGDLGVSSALIYERENPKSAANIAFIVSLVTGGLWFALVYLTAPFIAEFFHDPETTLILRILATVFLINSLGNVHDSLLRKELAFGKRLIPDLAGSSIKGTISILLAFWGWGVWSLVWGHLAGALITTAVLWLTKRWAPSIEGSIAQAKRMVKYGGQIISVNIVSAIVHDADYVVVGRMLGSAALGLYVMAYRIPELAITMIIWVIGRVAFPVYAKLREDQDALRYAFLKTLRYLSLLTIPAGIGLALLGRQFIEVFFGARWLDAAAAMQALAIAGCLRSLGSHAGDIYKATGRPDILVKLGLARAAILIPAMIWSAQYGIFGVAIAQIAVTAISTVVNLVIVGRLLSVPVGDMLFEFRDAFVGSVIMALAVYMSTTVVGGLSLIPQMLGLVTIGIAAYFAYMLIFNRAAVSDVMTFFTPALSGKSAR